MKTDSMAHRLLAFTLVVTVVVLGRPLPAGAAGNEVEPVARQRGLTIQGRPLSEVVGATAGVRGRVPLPRLLEQQGSGQISGVALDGTGKLVAGETVQLRHVRPPTEVVVTTTTDANGRFSFAALGPGRYIVDLRLERRVAATSGLISLAEGE